MYTSPFRQGGQDTSVERHAVPRLAHDHCDLEY